MFFFLLALGMQRAYAAANSTDTASADLQKFLMKGKVTGHMRTYFMATDNYRPLTDYYSLAMGAGIGYQTPVYKGITAGFSGFFLFNVLSNDLGAVDPLGRGNSRYELGNFDLQDPYNRANLERLESLFIRYLKGNSTITLGRQNLLTPFINPQDGRMRPSLQDGLWLEIKEWKHLHIQSGFFYGMSPRSSVSWFTVGQSIGFYPVGVNPNGTPSGYRNSIFSRYATIFNADIHLSKALKLSYWHYHVHNVFNLHFLQKEIRQKVNKHTILIAGLQSGYQTSSGNGGNSDPSKAYMLPGHTAAFFSFRMGAAVRSHQLTLNYTHILDQDRFLFPREWGIEPFYTFMARERNEGTANTHAFTLRYENRPKKHLMYGTAFGWYELPDVLNFRQNKYGLPSYNQLNIFLNYSFKGPLHGLNLQALYVYKGLAGNTHGDLRYVFNRVMMSNYNLIINYHI